MERVKTNNVGEPGKQTFARVEGREVSLSFDVTFSISLETRKKMQV